MILILEIHLSYLFFNLKFYFRFLLGLTDVHNNGKTVLGEEHFAYLVSELVSEPARYNHFQNILTFFNLLPNFHFTVSETMRDYYI